jgi:hypothetical protein
MAINLDDGINVLDVGTFLSMVGVCIDAMGHQEYDD